MAPNRGSDSGKKAGRKSTKQVHAQKMAVTHEPDAKLDKAAPVGAGLPIELQQRTLDCFVTAFRDVIEARGDEKPLQALLQEVKGHLYNRDFSEAFGREDYLEVYAIRWSASRALGYIEVFVETLQKVAAGYQAAAGSRELPKDLQQLTLGGDGLQASTLQEVNVLALGGGAGAELCAIAAARGLTEIKPRVHLSLVDRADWRTVLQKLEQALVQPASVSPYASAAIKAVTSMPLIDPVNLQATFDRLDLLEPGKQQDLLNYSTSQADLITLAFTLNELYTTSLSKTQSFLLVLTEATKPGALLLIIDSPGSYSTVTINGRERKYPMHWLLKHTLLKVAPEALNEDSRDPASEASDTKHRSGGEVHALWQLVDSTPSRWHRLPQGLRSPLELENMRFQMSLWRRL